MSKKSVEVIVAGETSKDGQNHIPDGLTEQ